MDDKIREQLRIKKVREMKNPIILMNSDDFYAFKTELESTIKGYKVGENPTYEGVPIKVTDIVKRGNIVVYDDAPRNCCV